MDPQQELFTAILMALKESPYKERVYDGHLPAAGTEYPFIYLANNQMIDAMTKGPVYGHVIQTIDVYSNNPQNRGTLSLILFAIKNICRRINKTDNFTWSLTGVNQQVLPDNTTNEPLLHGVLTLEFDFS